MSVSCLGYHLTHWGRVTHICISKLTIIGSDDGLSPGRRQAIIRTNAGILSIEPLRTNFSEFSIKIQTFSFKEMHLKMLSGKWQPFCLGLNVLTHWVLVVHICIWSVNWVIIGSGNHVNDLLSLGNKLLFDCMITYDWLDHSEQTSVKFKLNYDNVYLSKCMKISCTKCCLFGFGLNMLIHCDLVMPYDDIDLGQQWLR